MAFEDIHDDSVCEACGDATVPCSVCLTDLTCLECNEGTCPACEHMLTKED